MGTMRYYMLNTIIVSLHLLGGSVVTLGQTVNIRFCEYMLRDTIG